jgi:hypothetical protein
MGRFEGFGSVRRAFVAACILLPPAIVGCNALVDLRDIDEAPSTSGGADATPDSPVVGNDAGDGGSPADASADVRADVSLDAGADADGGCAVIPGLVAWWRGEDDANDEVGGRNGTWTDGTPTYVAGKSGKAFSLNAGGGGGFVNIPHDPALSLAIPFTISVWVNSPGDNLRIVDKLTNGVNDGYLLDLNTTRQPRFISGAGYMQAPSGLVNANTWHHVVAVAATTTSRTVYVDGVVAVVQTLDLSGPVAPNVPLRFGANGDGTSRFPGLADEIALFNRALTPAEVVSIYARGSESLCR